MMRTFNRIRTQCMSPLFKCHTLTQQLEMNITPIVGGDNAVVEPEDDDDPDGDENMSHENSMQVAA